MGTVPGVTNNFPILTAAPNFRDLGGYATQNGERVRSGMLYRADSLYGMEHSDLTALRSLGLRQVIDLRTETERARKADQVPDGAEYVSLDVTPTKNPPSTPTGERDSHSYRSATPGSSDTPDAPYLNADLVTLLADAESARALLADNGAERFMHSVNRMLVASDEACSGYRELIQRAATGPPALVFHCSAGKDRTGWGAAVLLRLLGVPTETVIADYLVSNARLGGLEDWAHLLARNYGFAPEVFLPLVEVRREYLETAFAEVDRLHGSFDAYVRDGLGVSPHTLRELRERMLEPRL